MGRKRKQTIAKREAKQARQDARKLEILERLLRAMDLTEVFAKLPRPLLLGWIVEGFAPGIEVLVAQDSAGDPEVKEVAAEIKRLIKTPQTDTVRGRPYHVALDDIYRGLASINAGVRSLAAECRSSPRPRMRALRGTMDEIVAALERFDHSWFDFVFAKLVMQIEEVTNRNYRVDGRMISSKFIPALKPEGGREFTRIVVRLHQAQARPIGDDRETGAYPCIRNFGSEGLMPVQWKLDELGIEGPKMPLPVLVTKHAIDRLEERLPLRGHESWLHNMLIDSFRYPEIARRDDGSCLVEARPGGVLAGYFVAEILPRAVLVKTFLFLTMHGTPVSECLRRTLGLHRIDIERYELDNFYTLTATDLGKDPLLSRVLSECGCGPLIHLFNLKNRLEWIESHGRHLKEEVGLRELGNGFLVGNKWTRWTEPEEPPP